MKLPTRTTLAAAVAAALAATTLLAGCGGDDSSSDAKDRASGSLSANTDSSASSGESASGSGGSDDFTSQSGDDIADAAKADMKTLNQVRYSGSITSDGSDITLDIQASSTGDCTGTIGIGGGTAELLSKDGSSWFRPDEAFWRASSPDSADQIIAAVGDKWVLDTDKNFTQFCDLGAFFDNVFSDDGAGGSYETTGSDSLDGQDVVKVAKTDDQGTATGYVLVDSPHYLLKLEKTEGDEPGQLAFTDFDEEFDVTAPADDEVVDLSQLG